MGFIQYEDIFCKNYDLESYVNKMSIMAPKFIVLPFQGIHNAYTSSVSELSSGKVWVPVSKLFFYFLHIIRYFHLHYTVLCLTNVNVNAQLTNSYGFCYVTAVALTQKDYPNISGLYISRK